MFGGFYKKVLDELPSAVIVLDKKYKVKFANTAFLRWFAGENKKNRTLKDCINCREETEVCGRGEACGYCRFKGAFKETIESGNPSATDVILDVGFRRKYPENDRQNGRKTSL